MKYIATFNIFSGGKLRSALSGFSKSWRIGTVFNLKLHACRWHVSIDSHWILAS